ncbi:MAG: alpha/beta fold hydrolase [Vicinamibacterales bacterium]
MPSTIFADEPFVPARGLFNGHVVTIYAWARGRVYPGLAAPESRLIRIDSETQVRADCYWQAGRRAHPTLLCLHGLEGSSEGHYMRGIAHKALRRGWNVVLLNQRNCGGTEHLTPALYHSGLTEDPVAVLRALMADEGLTRFSLAGYSLGGNLAIKLAGELADTPDLPVVSVAAVCPTIDLALCSRALEWRRNHLYSWNFLKGLKARMRRKARAFPGRYDLAPLDRIRSIRQFDDTYTAPSHGFGTAARYYELASAIRTVSRIAIPTLIVAAENDPFVPVSQFLGEDIRRNPHLRVSVQRHGGHCGFVGRPTRDSDGYWAEDVVVDFLTNTQDDL